MFESSDQSYWKHSEINASFPSNTKAHLEIRTKSKTRGNRDFFQELLKFVPKCIMLLNARMLFFNKAISGGQTNKNQEAKLRKEGVSKSNYVNNSRKLKVCSYDFKKSIFIIKTVSDLFLLLILNLTSCYQFSMEILITKKSYSFSHRFMPTPFILQRYILFSYFTHSCSYTHVQLYQSPSKYF